MDLYTCKCRIFYIIDFTCLHTAYYTIYYMIFDIIKSLFYCHSDEPKLRPACQNSVFIYTVAALSCVTVCCSVVRRPTTVSCCVCQHCNKAVLLLLLFFNPRKNEGGKKLRKVEKGLKWKTSPGGPHYL